MNYLEYDIHGKNNVARECDLLYWIGSIRNYGEEGTEDMKSNEATVGSSLLEAMEDYAGKIRRVVVHDPGNTVELACLYSGISGMKECVIALRKNGFVSAEENLRLEREILELYALCSPGPRSSLGGEEERSV